MGQGHSRPHPPPARCPAASHPSAFPRSHLLASHYVERHIGTGKNSSHSTVSTVPRRAKQHHRAHGSMPGCEHRAARCSPRFMDDGRGWLHLGSLMVPLCPAPGVRALPQQMTQGHASCRHCRNGLPACPWHGSAHCHAHSPALGPWWCLLGRWAGKAANPRGHQRWVQPPAMGRMGPSSAIAAVGGSERGRWLQGAARLQQRRCEKDKWDFQK